MTCPHRSRRFSFPGLEAWRSLVRLRPRWKQAYEDVAPLVRLEATEDTALTVVTLDQLK